jgi:hypothetical protein
MITVDVLMEISPFDEDERQRLRCDQELCRQQRIV